MALILPLTLSRAHPIDIPQRIVKNPSKNLKTKKETLANLMSPLTPTQRNLPRKVVSGT